MNKKVTKDIVIDTMREPKAFAPKKPYTHPSLHIFGSLHLLTQGGSGGGNDGFGMMSGTMGMMGMGMSDRRLKENIVRIGTHPLGFGLYLFDYKPAYRGVSGDGRQFGVMADEVETVMPLAVATHPFGHKTVNYAMLGISRPD